MNIPPLISRTPPPISDVVDDEDDEDEDDVNVFSSLQFCTPKSPENTIDEFPKVASSEVFNSSKMDTLETGENNIINNGRKHEMKNAEESRLPTFPFPKQDAESHNDVKSNHVHDISENGRCGPSNKSVFNEILFDQNIDESFSIEILGNTINDERDERDLPEDLSSFQLGVPDQIKQEEDSDSKDSGNNQPIDNDYFYTSQATSIEEDEYLKSDGGKVPTEDHLNLYDSKLGDIKSIVDQETVSKTLATDDGYLDNVCQYMDRSACAEVSSNQSGQDDKCIVNCSADICLDNDKEPSDNTHISDNADLLDGEELSSRFTLEFDCDSVVNAVCEETDTPPVAEETCDSFNVTSTDKLSRVSESCLGFVDSVSDVKPKLSSIPEFEQMAPDFCVTFPNQVQNYQLEQVSKHFNDDGNDDDGDNEFSDFVKCSFEPEVEASVVPEKIPPQVVESYQVVSEELVKNQISPLLLLCLKEELKKTAVWTTLSCLETTPALDYGWRSSYSSSRLLSALKIDSRNILSGLWMKSVRKSSSENGMKQCNIKHKESSYPDIGFNEVCVPRPQFEWVGSGLTNPLVGGSTDLLDLELVSFGNGCSATEPTHRRSNGVNSRVKKSSLSRLSIEAENLVTSLPDLSFLKQSFIVFPKNIN